MSQFYLLSQMKVIERSVVKQIEYPIFNKIINKVEVIFEDAEPILKTEDETV